VADALTFADGVLGGKDSVKGFTVLATDGKAGRVSWASYAPGESYLVVTVGLLSRKHHVVAARAVTSVGDRTVSVALSRADIKGLPDLAKPYLPLDAPTADQVVAMVEAAYARTRGDNM
jgi:hypothetical protein